MNRDGRATPTTSAPASEEQLDRALASMVRGRQLALFPVVEGAILIEHVKDARTAGAASPARLLHTDGTELGREEHPVSRVLRGDALDRHPYRVAFDSGEVHHIELATVTATSNGAAATSSGVATTTSLIAIDVTATRRTEDELRHLAATDELTGVANGRTLTARLNSAISRHRDEAERLAVLCINLDGYRTVNDNTSADLGSMIVTETARRLITNVRDHELVAYLGGERFVVVLEPLGGRDDAVAAAERIRRAINVPMQFGRREFSISASIGVAFNTRRTEDARQLLFNGDAAVRTAKEQGRNDWAVFDEQLRARTIAALKVESLIDAALRDDRFTVEYQPVVDVSTRRPIAFEAFARLRTIDGPLLGPSSFLRIAEETGRVHAIDVSVLDQACDEAQRLVQIPTADPRMQVSVNLSAATIQRHDLHSIVLEACEEHDIDPCRLSLEFPEEALLSVTTATRASFEELRADGVGLIVDGNGTGPLGLAHLAQVPISAIKLHGRLLRDVTGPSVERAVTRAVIAHAHALGLEAIAKGVETEEQAEALAELGCDRLQGYLFGRPTSGADAERLLLDS